MAIAAQVVFGDIMSHHSEGSSFSSSFDDADSDYYAMLQDFKSTRYNSDRSLSSFVSDVTDSTYWLEDIPIRDTARENRMLSQESKSDLPPRPFARKPSISSQSFSDDCCWREEEDNDTPPCLVKRALSIESSDLSISLHPLDKIKDTRHDIIDNDTAPRPYPKRQESRESLVQPSSALAKLAEEFVEGITLRTHTYHLKMYRNTFVGSEAVDFMVNSGLALTREDAVFLGQRFLTELNLFFHVYWDHTFKDGYYFYRLTSRKDVLLTTRKKKSISKLRDIADDFESHISLSSHMHHFKKYKNSFLGREAVDLIVQFKFASTRTEAVFLGQRLIDELDVFHHVSHSYPFKDSDHVYRLSRDDDGSLSESFSSFSLSEEQSTRDDSCFHSAAAPPRPIPPKPNQRPKGTVKFGTVQERVFDRVLDINPSTSHGPSVGLGWNYIDESPRTIQPTEEKTKSDRDLNHFHLSCNSRKSILREFGHSKFEMFLGTRLNERLREQRKRTLNKLTVGSKATEGQRH